MSLVNNSGKNDFEQQNPSQVLEVGGPRVVAPCGGFDGRVDSIPDDVGRDALDDPVKDLGLGNPIAEEGKWTLLRRLTIATLKPNGNPQKWTRGSTLIPSRGN